MNRIEVTFSYYSDESSANDSFHFSDEAAAKVKFTELRDIIEHNFADVANPEIIDEPGFFGIRDSETGCFARVTIEY